MTGLLRYLWAVALAWLYASVVWLGDRLGRWPDGWR